MKNPPLLFLDFETSGLDPARHGIIQVAWILEKDGDIVAEKCFDVQLDSQSDICMAALDVNGFTISRIIMGKTLSYMIAALKGDLFQAVTSDLLPRPVGHNIGFDLGFLKVASEKCREHIQFHLDFKRAIDTRAVLQWFDYCGKIYLSDYKLETACKFYGITLRPHDALEDVRAVRQLFHFLKP